MRRHLVLAALALAACQPTSTPGRSPDAGVDAALDSGADAGIDAGAAARAEASPRVGATTAPPPPDRALEVAEGDDPFPSVSTLADLPAAEHPTRVRHPRFESPALSGVTSARHALRRARRHAARDPGPRTYLWTAFQLGSADLETQLAASVETVLHPHPMDFVYYCEVERTAEVTPDAFDVQEPRTDAEIAAVDALAAQLDALARAHPELRFFTVRGGWADAVGAADHGIAVVDPETGEAVWIYAMTYWEA